MLTLFTAYPVYTIRASLLMILNVNAVVSVALVVSVAFRQYRLHTFNTIVLVVCNVLLKAMIQQAKYSKLWSLRWRQGSLLDATSFALIRCFWFL